MHPRRWLTPIVLAALPSTCLCAFEASGRAQESTERPVMMSEAARALMREARRRDLQIDEDTLQRMLSELAVESSGESATPLSLPGDMEASAATPQHISLPTAEGSVQGMGESFSPVLSAGTATYSVPIALPAGRAGLSPSIALNYSSSGGNGALGFGWDLPVAYVARQTDRGLPQYDDRPLWHPQEDRFIFNGGQELVPVAVEDVLALDDGHGPPSGLATWQQYRARVEGQFMRFYRDPSGRRWIVESPDGSRMELGELPTSELPSDFGAVPYGLNASSSALMSEEPYGGGRIARWYLTRMSDAHGSTVYYRYFEDGGSRYLRDVHYTSPALCASGGNADAQRTCTRALLEYGRRIRFEWEPREDAYTSYVSGWGITAGLRLVRIAVTAAEGAPGSRTMVDRYHFAYDPASFLTLLATVRVEGRPHTTLAGAGVLVGDATVSEATVDASPAPIGPLLPAMRFGYTSVNVSGAPAVAGFGRLDPTMHTSGVSPPHSVDEASADLFDVNSDGLTDLIVTEPGRFRTPDRRPAVGVYFNGFSGPDADPAVPGVFSDPVPVAVPSSLSSVLDLGNANVVPMDIDGDGRSDLLHMPRRANYGYFVATRNADASAISPADQGWAFTHVPVALDAGETDPRIDLGADAAHIRVLDVNNDGLIDVVRTTGTAMQTWLNLGWLPDGEGRFGSYEARTDSTGATYYLYSTEPYESCLLQSAGPIDFADPEVRLADMNGDGLQDIVQMRRGFMRYWPGRGLGLWGEGPAICGPGEGGDRYLDVETPPAELNTELAGVYLDDINHDGAADVVQVRFDEVDVWINRAGMGFTPRTIMRHTPFAPSFAPRVRFADIDGSGTTDIVFGNAGDWRWVDPMGGTRPRLLRTIENGLGALTTLEYGSSAQDYLRDLRDAEVCYPDDATCDRFTWSGIRGSCDARLQALTGACVYRSGGSPVVSTVVSAVSTSDQLAALGRENTVSRSEYRYHDGYYEGIEQEFRGFGAADVENLSHVNDTHREGVTRTWFHQGRRPNELATDRLADSPYEALKGREYQTESWDRETGGRISTSHTTYTVRRLLVGLDGRAVRFAYASRSDVLRYNVAMGVGDEGTLELPSVVWQTVTDGGAIPPDGGSDADHVVAQRGLGTIRVQTVSEQVDNRGQVGLSGALGRPGVDERIDQHATYVRTSGRWLWRQASTYVTGSSAPSLQLARTDRTYNANGDLQRTVAQADLPGSGAFEFGDDDNGAEGFTQLDQELESSSTYDEWGNALSSCVGLDLTAAGEAGCHRYAEVDYDLDYQQFPTVERIAYDRSGPSSLSFFVTTGEWDRGLSVLESATDPTGAQTSMGYDGFGRVTFVRPPASDGQTTAVPARRFAYDLVVDGLPISVVHSWAEHDPTGIGVDAIETRTYVDGLGRTRATLTPASADCDGAAQWVQSGIAILNQRGSARRSYQQAFIDEAAPTPSRALRIPATDYEWGTFDAFDRPTCTTTACGDMTCTTYHALTTDVCDALDMSGDLMHAGTCTTTRNDGHGRAVDQILRNRQVPAGAIEYYRLWTDYRADNAIVQLTRAQTTSDALRAMATVVTGHEVSRTFTYDTMARRIGTTDPDSDSLSTAPGRDATNKTWRYLFNEAGDLVAVRDPRGCGQNFYYDRAGRLIGEDYVECGEAQESGEVAGETIPATAMALGETGVARAVDVRSYFDAPPLWAAGFAEVMASDYEGRLAAVSDRGQRSAMAYDARGQVTWLVRQMVVIPDEPTLTVTNSNPGQGEPPLTSETPLTATPRIYDTLHSYERVAHYDHGGRPTSMTLPSDPDWTALGGTGSAPVIGGTLEYDERGLPHRVVLDVDGDDHVVIDSLCYTEHGLLRQVTYGDDTLPAGGGRSPTVSTTAYDTCLRPNDFETVRATTSYGGTDPRPLAQVTRPMAQSLQWDAANNLVRVQDDRIATEWPQSYRPQTVDITHDALYRVIDAEYTYHLDGGMTGTDTGRDWRPDLRRTATRSHDPMRTDPAPMLASTPPERVNSIIWTYDWLGNMQEWTDDAASFYERSLGDIENGADRATHERPAALHLASNVRPMSGTIDPLIDRGGWAELAYGEDGNVTSMLVHARCADSVGVACWDDATLEGDARADHLRASCVCQSEQHHEYRWDEVNRLSEARRYDRTGGSTGSWSLVVRQRYRYDSSNQRTVKQTVDQRVTEMNVERIALYVMPGDYERRGLVRAAMDDAYEASAALATETQYVVGGARVVWKHRDSITGLEPEQRITVPLTDLIQTTAAVLDLQSGELIEASTYYPNGARESYRAEDAVGIAAEPSGFTGKEADEEVGLVYFGERYLIPRLARWASVDPLAVHAVGGGEVANSYHYVSGNLLSARDPIGLDLKSSDTTYREMGGGREHTVSGERQAREQLELIHGGLMENERYYFMRRGNAIVATEAGLAAWASHVAGADSEDPLSEAAAGWMEMIMSEHIYEVHTLNMDEVPTWVRDGLHSRNGEGIIALFDENRAGRRPLRVSGGLLGETFWDEETSRGIADRVGAVSSAFNAEAIFEQVRTGSSDLTVTFTTFARDNGGRISRESVITAAHENLGHALEARRGELFPVHTRGLIPDALPFNQRLQEIEDAAAAAYDAHSIELFLQDTVDPLF